MEILVTLSLVNVVHVCVLRVVTDGAVSVPKCHLLVWLQRSGLSSMLRHAFGCICESIVFVFVDAISPVRYRALQLKGSDSEPRWWVVHYSFAT